MSSKETANRVRITLEQRRGTVDGSSMAGFHYWVVEVTNSLEPPVATLLSAQEAQTLIDAGYNVTVKMKK